MKVILKHPIGFRDDHTIKLPTGQAVPDLMEHLGTVIEEDKTVWHVFMIGEPY